MSDFMLLPYRPAGASRYDKPCGLTEAAAQFTYGGSIYGGSIAVRQIGRLKP